MSIWTARIAIVAGAAVSVGAGVAVAKDFRPGDLRACNAAKCVGIVDRGALKTFSGFYYGDRPVERALAPRLGAPAFRLKLGDMVAGIAATRRLDRVLVYGLYCGRFRRGIWYRLPTRAAVTLRRVTAGLAPLRVTGRVPRSC